jgi:ERCC4-type nuclease
MRELTDKEIALILGNIIIIVDTREQKNQHILDYFKMNNIQYRIEKLDTGDYSFILPDFTELNFDKKVLIEKKNSIDEIAGNFTKDRPRFQREMERIQDNHFHLIIENTTFKKMYGQQYRSQLPPKSLIASLLTWSIRYKFKVWFTGKDEIGKLIYDLIYYELMEMLKNLKKDIDSYCRR